MPAPATPYHNRSQLLRGIKFWESRGYRVKVAEGIAARDGYLAGSAEGRARDLMACFEDPQIDAIQCLQGGYGSNHLLPFLDYDVIAANPKPLIGYSDITSLHVAIRQRTGLVTFYGPGLIAMSAPEATSFTQDRLISVLRDGGQGPVPADPDDPFLLTLHGGRVTAPLVGGDLWELRETLATPWEVATDGALLFFEEVNVPTWQIDGMLAQLTHAGKLQQVAGVVVGQMAGCDWARDRASYPSTKSLEDVLEHYLSPLGVPVLYGLPLGHGTSLATIPLGVRATLDAGKQELIIEESGLTARSAQAD
ncbi:LD-carboxypeptidase [Planosporangium thailandense]|uniref:LD-carboxypeptidase n=1 Tax=Planosporangium thailandense TaxID=765197 RepID=A0ABX0Y4A9_9ACTN|nr:LD-carboxypeptidase [Planosporangium thailandense]